MATDDRRPRELWGTPIPDVRSTRGIVTRYLATDVLASTPGRAWSPAEIATELERRGFRSPGRLGKDVANGLRAEVNRGRVHRVGRGRYVVGHIPGATRRRIRAVARHRTALAQAALERELADRARHRFT